MTLPTYVLYAGDIIMLCRANKRGIRCILDIFKYYGTTLGQVISKDKSKLYAGAMSSQRVGTIQNWLGFKNGQIPFQYLECLIFKGKSNQIHF